jgi:hypothetical protein
MLILSFENHSRIRNRFGRSNFQCEDVNSGAGGQMTEESLYRLIVAFSAGVGLLLVGAMILLLAIRSSWSRSLVALASAGSCGLIPIFFGPPYLAIWSAGAIAFGGLLLAAVGSHYSATACQVLIRVIRRPISQAFVLSAAGVALVVGSMIRYSAEEQEVIDRDMAWLSELGAQPPMRSQAGVPAETDLGRPLDLKAPVEARSVGELSQSERRLLNDMRYVEKVLRVAPASDVCNCHGWVFTGGKYWMGPEDVERVLADNGYQPVSDPVPGDLAIYRDSTSITHTAVVCSAVPGQDVLVEGKWGWMGVFMHRVGDSAYGKNYTYYRGSRNGHLVVGLGGRPANVNAD